MSEEMVILKELQEVKAMLAVLVERQTVREYYSVEEFARIVGRAAFTCREWARHGRIRAEKRLSGRGAYPAWAISHDELLRYQREGLLVYRFTRSNAAGRHPVGKEA
jgi:hypothetical protein